LIDDDDDDANSDERRIIFKISSEAMKFAEVCLHLENFVQDKKIADFSISVKTLEQAFLEFASDQVQKPDGVEKKPWTVGSCFSKVYILVLWIGICYLMSRFVFLNSYVH